MITKHIKFNNTDGFELSARLEIPVGKPPAHYAIFAHCFTCGKNSKAATVIARKLTRSGFGVLRFDFTGLGDSEGAFQDTGFSSNLDDLVAAADYLTEHYDAPALLIGHSLGGTAAIHAGAKIESIKAICTLGAPFEAEHVMQHIGDDRDEIIRKGSTLIKLGGTPFRIGSKFVTDLETHKTAELLPGMRKALLVFHSPQDDVVGINNAESIFKAAFHPKSFVSLDRADHLLTDTADATYAADVIAAWSCKFLPAIAEEKLTTDEDVAAQIGSEEGYSTEVVAGLHHFMADEPAKVGGKDLGPTPYQLLNAALGACTAMTMKMYANRKKWPLEKVTVHLSHSKKHVEDSANPENSQSKVEVFKRYLEIEGELDTAQIKKLMEIADKCPVHRTLTERELRIETVLRP